QHQLMLAAMLLLSSFLLKIGPFAVTYEICLLTQGETARYSEEAFALTCFHLCLKIVSVFAIILALRWLKDAHVLASYLNGAYLGGETLDCGCSHAAMLECCWNANVVINLDLGGAAWRHACSHAVFDAPLSIPAATCLSQTVSVVTVILALW
ncbi:hypothetical protein Tco_1423077, partial [Tanacetum coccineum]